MQQRSSYFLPLTHCLLISALFQCFFFTPTQAQHAISAPSLYYSHSNSSSDLFIPPDNTPTVANDHLSIQIYLNNLVFHLIQTASELPPPPIIKAEETLVDLTDKPSNKEVRIVDEKLYIDGKVVTRYEAEQYLLDHPAAPIELNLHKDTPYEEVIENLLYINGELASVEQAKHYLQQHPEARLELNYQLDTKASAKVAIIPDNNKSESTINLPDNSKNNNTITIDEPIVAAANNTTPPINKLKGKGYELIAGLIYIDGDIATRKQAETYLAKNPKLKNKVNLNYQLQDDSFQAPAAAIKADQPKSPAIEHIDEANDNNSTFEIIQKVLYIDGDIATRSETNQYIAKNPKKKSLIDLKLQPDWSWDDDANPSHTTADQPAQLVPSHNHEEEISYKIIESILYIDGDIATRDEAKNYLSQHPKAKFNMSLQPEFIDDYDPITAAESILRTTPAPNTIFSNPEVIDGKLYINGKVASAKEKASYEAATGIYIKYDKMIGDVDRSLGKINHQNLSDNPITIPATGEKILLSKLYDEDIPCFAHYDGIWDNNNVFPYRYNLTQMPQRVEFLLTNGLEGDFAMPCIGDVTSNFGRRWGRHHNGIDVDLETGDAVFAAFEGKVRCAQYSSSFGYLVVIRHYNGLETFYAHLSALMVRPNDNVKAGTIIGLGGTTGRSTGSHLHFEVRYKGQPFNPALLIDFDAQQLRKNTFTVDRYFFSSDNPNAIEDSHSNGGGHSHRKTSKAKKGAAKYHTVRKGDTLIEIAQRNKTTVKKLCALNRLSSRTTLAIGRKVRTR